MTDRVHPLKIDRQHVGRVGLQQVQADVFKSPGRRQQQNQIVERIFWIKIQGGVILEFLAAATGDGVPARQEVIHKMSAFLFGFNYLMTRILWRGTVCGSLDLPPGQGAVSFDGNRFGFLGLDLLLDWRGVRCLL